jgi:hypothetical protein
LAYQTPEQVLGKGKKEEQSQSTNTFVIQ